MDELRVGFAALAEAEQAMRRTVTQVDALLDDLTAYLKPLTASWTGAAAEAYQQSQADWTAAAIDQQKQLAELHRLVVTAHRNHANAVSTNSRMWTV